MADLSVVFSTLPRPTSLQFSFPKQWGSEETGGWSALADGNFVAAGQSAVAYRLSDIGGPKVTAAVENKYSRTVNKRNKMLFQDLPFRVVAFQWTLRPRSAARAETFAKMIDKLKYLSAPKLIPGEALWDSADMTWALSIKTSNRMLFHANHLVITNLIVNYTPNGFWSQHNDGYPTQIQFDLELSEVELAHRDNLASSSALPAEGAEWGTKLV